MDVLKETFSEEDLETGGDVSFESRVEAEIEKVKQQIRNLGFNPRIDVPNKDKVKFKVNDWGGVVMVVGDRPDHILDNEYERQQFRKGSDMKRLMRKLEDLAYAEEHGEFPEEPPRPSLISEDPSNREKETTPRDL
jgi:hypothetical protein